tara:strand:+ start:2429 stop:3271 length:843 start_codon:yes stop_codon:yes gene_type:complete
MIKASIYIPAYNAEKTISKVLESVFNQSIPFDEVIVVNDCSRDNTLNYLKPFSNLRVINNKENKGLSYCRNIALESSKNNYVASIDADVVLNKHWFEKISAHLNNDIALIGGNLIEKYTDNIYNYWRSIYYKQNWGNKDIQNPAFVFGCNNIQNKLIWKKINGYDEKLKSNGEDIEYSMRIREKGYSTFYCHDAHCYHLQNDDIRTLSARVWRYHSYGYKVKKVGYTRLAKLVLKQFNFFFKRSFKNLIKFDFKFILINFVVLTYFIKLEFINVVRNKKN